MITGEKRDRSTNVSMKGSLMPDDELIEINMENMANIATKIKT